MASSFKSPGDTRWTLMFRELKQVVAQPTKEHPAARVWRESDLKAVITKVRKREIEELKSTFPPAKDVITRMLAMGWLREIPLADKAPTVYLLDMEATEEELPNSWELMQGYNPSGVLCYFGAASFYELTTQVPSFYHIASLRSSVPNASPEKTQSNTSTSDSDRQRDQLGTFEFRFQGVDYYATSRDESTIPGVQTRNYGPRTQLRITTLEQTMLDTLWQPLKFGGESIVFEVWERGVQKWNPEKMSKHLATIDRQDWIRRVGAMLSLLGVDVDESLQSLLTNSRKALKDSVDDTPLTLMPGLLGSNLLEEWGVLTP